MTTGLNQGGAEASLCGLLHASRAEAEHVVISMTDEGVYGPSLREFGFAVHTLGFPRGRLTPNGLLRLWRLIIDSKPDAVQTWMYHADLAVRFDRSLGRNPKRDMGYSQLPYEPGGLEPLSSAGGLPLCPAFQLVAVGDHLLLETCSACASALGLPGKQNFDYPQRLRLAAFFAAKARRRCLAQGVGR